MIPSIRSRIQMSVSSTHCHWEKWGLSYTAWPRAQDLLCCTCRRPSMSVSHLKEVTVSLGTSVPLAIKHQVTGWALSSLHVQALHFFETAYRPGYREGSPGTRRSSPFPPVSAPQEIRLTLPSCALVSHLLERASRSTRSTRSTVSPLLQ